MSKLLLILIILLPSCSTLTNESSKGILFGQWMLINNNGGRCNVCPTVEFINDNKGFIITPSEEKIEFNYHLNENKKNLSFNGTERFFGKDKEFYFNLYEGGNIQSLKLNSLNGNGKYELSREVKTK